MIFLELTTDSFEEERARQASSGKGSMISRNSRVARRPTRGMEIKEECPAAIKIVQADGREIPLADAGSPDGSGKRTGGYTNFLLQQVVEARMEKHQIIETFGESYIHFFGEAPRFIDVQMVVINSLDFNWEAEWWYNYETYFRGTKLVEMGARMYLFYDDNIVEGYMLNSQAVKLSDQPFLVQMNFRMFITSYRNISFVGTESAANYPIRAAVVDLDKKRKGTTDEEVIDRIRTQPRLGTGPTATHISDLSGIDTGNLDMGSESPSNVTGLSTTHIPSSKPLREKIMANLDEYIGGSGSPLTYNTGQGDLQPTEIATIRTQQEVDDLWLAAVAALQCHGADINDPTSFSDLGLMASKGRSVNDPATFNPTPGKAYGGGLSNPYSRAPWDQVRHDSLSAVFGAGVSLRMISDKNTQGGGDRDYGYNSPYGNGPGFGKAGYGGFGGKGMGSGQGDMGDPGFKKPGSFSFIGVADASAAFGKFNSPSSNDSSVWGAGASGSWDPQNGFTGSSGAGRVGLADSNSGLSGGGAVSIDGKPSPFSLIAVDGVLGTGVGDISGFGIGNNKCPDSSSNMFKESFIL